MTLFLLSKERFDLLLEKKPALGVKLVLKIAKMPSLRLSQTSGTPVDFLKTSWRLRTFFKGNASGKADGCRILSVMGRTRGRPLTCPHTHTPAARDGFGIYCMLKSLLTGLPGKNNP